MAWHKNENGVVMSDEMQDLKDRMRAHHESVRLFLFSVGSTLIQCQAFEDRLRQYKLLVYGRKSGMTAEEFKGILARSRKQDTLGTLLKDLGTLTAMEPKTKALLDEMLAERNWFTHHLEYEHGLAPYDPDALVPLLQRLHDIQRRALHLQKEFEKLVIAFTTDQGFSTDQIDAGTRDLLNNAIK